MTDGLTTAVDTLEGTVRGLRAEVTTLTTKTKRDRKVVAFDILLSVAVFFLGFQLHNQTGDACRSANGVRTEVVGFVGDTVDRSKRANEATIESPLATADQKSAARKNLHQIEKYNTALKERLAPESC